jgi:hypothetical protein
MKFTGKSAAFDLSAETYAASHKSRHGHIWVAFHMYQRWCMLLLAWTMRNGVRNPNSREEIA